MDDKKENQILRDVCRAAGHEFNEDNVCSRCRIGLIQKKLRDQLDQYLGYKINEQTLGKIRKTSADTLHSLVSDGTLLSFCDVNAHMSEDKRAVLVEFTVADLYGTYNCEMRLGQ